MPPQPPQRPLNYIIISSKPPNLPLKNPSHTIATVYEPSKRKKKHETPISWQPQQHLLPRPLFSCDPPFTDTLAILPVPLPLENARNGKPNELTLSKPSLPPHLHPSPYQIYLIRHVASYVKTFGSKGTSIRARNLL